MFAPVGEKDIVYSCKTLPISPVRLNDKARLEEIILSLEHFDPDIIYIFSFHKWYELVGRLKKAFPTKKYILDIQSPTLHENQGRKTKLQKGSERGQHHLDAIVSFSEKSVETWIPSCVHQPVIYPLGIDLSLFQPVDSTQGRRHCHRFVYIGSLHPKRQVDVLVDFFKDFAKQSSQPVSLDIYGSGPAYEEKHLRNMIASHGLGHCIRLAGLWPQEDLSKRLPDYDAGIAWVPYEIYDHSPSLKALEYMASGLPILASDTGAHKALVQQGYTIDFFSNNRDSFCTALDQVLESGFSAERILQNREAVKRFDYDAIIQRYILPLFAELVGSARPATPARLTLESLVGDLVEKTNNELKGTVLGSTNSSHQKKGALKLLLLLCDSVVGGKIGAERVILEMANAMSTRGHLVYTAYSNTVRPAYQITGRIILLPYASMATLGEKFRAIDPDVIFVFYIDRILIYYYSLFHNTNIPFGMQECTNPDRLCNNWKRQGKLASEGANWEREIIGSAAARIRLTMPDYALSFPDYIQPSVCVFPNPAFPQQKLADPAGDSSGRKAIINIGGMKNKNKNLMVFLQAFAHLAPAFSDWDIKVFGEHAEGIKPHEREIFDFIQAHGLGGRVQICGPTDDIFPEYTKAHIHVISSLSEGCPTCVLEAMATGLPSIGFADCPGTNQLIHHEENGLLASPEDRVSSMENALRRLMSSADLRARLGRQALEDSKAFDPCQVYDQWETLFHEAAEYKKDPGRLLREQMAIDPERAMHAYRCRKKLIERL